MSTPPSLARRTFKVPGRGPAPLGRPLRDRAGQTQMFITDNEDIIARSDGNFIQQTKKHTQICQNSGDKYQCSKKTHKTIMVYSYNKSNTWKIFYLLYHFVRLKRLISGRSHKWRHHFWGYPDPPAPPPPPSHCHPVIIRTPPPFVLADRGGKYILSVRKIQIYD